MGFSKEKKRVEIYQYINYWLTNIGFDLRKFASLRRLPGVIREYRQLKRMNKLSENKWALKFSMPSFYDWYDKSGVATGHYFHQDLYVAQEVYAQKPIKHVDVGSRVETFVSHVASYRNIEVLDIRPLESNSANISYRQCDFTSLPEDLYEYCDSVSCLHALEHFGLGRYQDTIDLEGHLKGFESLYGILKKDGLLYLSFPIGRERIEFNAHRVFDVCTPLNWIKGRMELLKFSYVDDEGNFFKDIDIKDMEEVSRQEMSYGCGIYVFKKL